MTEDEKQAAELKCLLKRESWHEFALTPELNIERRLQAEPNGLEGPIYRRTLRLIDKAKLLGILEAAKKSALERLPDSDLVARYARDPSHPIRILMNSPTFRQRWESRGHNKLVNLSKIGDKEQKKSAAFLKEMIFSQLDKTSTNKLDRLVEIANLLGPILANPKKRAGRSSEQTAWATYTEELDAMFISVSNRRMTISAAANLHCKRDNSLTTRSPENNRDRKRKLVTFYHQRRALRKESPSV
jgi:hypothetical protein